MKRLMGLLATLLLLLILVVLIFLSDKSLLKDDKGWRITKEGDIEIYKPSITIDGNMTGLEIKYSDPNK